MRLNDLLDYTEQLLQVEGFRDYCPNGLQVEGRTEIGSIVSGVSASMALLEAAEIAGADLVLVHHGYFWKSEDPRILGTRRSRLKFLLDRNINLAAYHLPLDAHRELGNNALLASMLGFEIEGWFGDQSIAAYGRLARPMPLAELGQQISVVLQREPLLIGDMQKTIHRIAWCSGAAQDYLGEAADLGVDAFLSGEVSERTFHLACESGVAYIAAGHHATERYGVQALGEHLARRFGIRHQYIEIPNPV